MCKYILRETIKLAFIWATLNQMLAMTIGIQSFYHDELEKYNPLLSKIFVRNLI